MGGDPNWSADARSVFALCLPGNKTHMERVLLALAALVAAGCGVCTRTPVSPFVGRCGMDRRPGRDPDRAAGRNRLRLLRRATGRKRSPEARASVGAARPRFLCRWTHRDALVVVTGRRGPERRRRRLADKPVEAAKTSAASPVRLFPSALARRSDGRA